MQDVTLASIQEGIQGTGHGQGGSNGHGAQTSDDVKSGKKMS